MKANPQTTYEAWADLGKQLEELKLAIVNEFAWILRPVVNFLAGRLKGKKT